MTDHSTASLTPAAPQQSQPDYRAIFFDLDGTLLPMELEEFLGGYFQAIAGFVAERGMDAQVFSQGLKAGIAAMAAHEDSATNYQAYWDAFFNKVGADDRNWDEFISDFYEHDFGTLGADVCPNPAAAQAIATLVAKGYPLVLTTMPMFPRRAVEWRLEWAGVDPQSFMRLTSYENSTSVKPKLAYYAENLAACGLSGAEVLMVGNNTIEDLSICALGADAFLVTDCLLDPTHAFDVETVRHGSLEEFAAWVETLPKCAHPATTIEPGVVAPAARDAVLEAAEVSVGGGEEASRIAQEAALGGQGA